MLVSCTCICCGTQAKPQDASQGQDICPSSGCPQPPTPDQCLTSVWQLDLPTISLPNRVQSSGYEASVVSRNLREKGEKGPVTALTHLVLGSSETPAPS